MGRLRVRRVSQFDRSVNLCTAATLCLTADGGSTQSQIEGHTMLKIVPDPPSFSPLQVLLFDFRTLFVLCEAGS